MSRELSGNRVWLITSASNQAETKRFLELRGLSVVATSLYSQRNKESYAFPEAPAAPFDWILVVRPIGHLVPDTFAMRGGRTVPVVRTSPSLKVTKEVLRKYCITAKSKGETKAKSSPHSLTVLPWKESRIKGRPRYIRSSDNGYVVASVIKHTSERYEVRVRPPGAAAVGGATFVYSAQEAKARADRRLKEFGYQLQDGLQDEPRPVEPTPFPLGSIPGDQTLPSETLPAPQEQKQETPESEVEQTTEQTTEKLDGLKSRMEELVRMMRRMGVLSVKLTKSGYSFELEELIEEAL